MGGHPGRFAEGRHRPERKAWNRGVHAFRSLLAVSSWGLRSPACFGPPLVPRFGPCSGRVEPRVLRPRSCLARSSRRLRPRPAEPWHAPRCACFGPPLVPRFGPCSGRGGPGFFVVALSCSFLAATPAPPAEPWHAPSDTPGGSRRLNSRRPTPWGEGGRTLLATPPVVPRGGKADVQPPGVEGVWRAPSEPPRVAAACTAAVDPRGRAASACD
jgi:hypothetical protein